MTSSSDKYHHVGVIVSVVVSSAEDDWIDLQSCQIKDYKNKNLLLLH